MKKEIKGLLTLSVALALVLTACATKTTTKATPTAQPTKAVIQSLNPNDINLDGTPPPAGAVTPSDEAPAEEEPVEEDPATTPTASAVSSATPTPTATVTPTSASTLASVKIVTPSSSTLAIGDTLTLSATVTMPDASANKTVTWSSSDSTIATVDSSGKITTIKAGSVTITATVNDKTDSISITVKAPATVSSLLIDTPSTTTPTVGNTLNLSATVTMSDASTNKTVTWSSSDSTIATVDSSGKVTTIKVGSVNITATSTIDTTKTNVIALTVSAAPVLVGNETKASIGQGILNRSGGIAFKNGKLYVTNWDNGGTAFDTNLWAEGEIKIFDTAGTLVTTKQGSTGNALPEDLTGIVTDGDRMWFTNRTPYAQVKNNLYSFDSAGNNRVDSAVGLINSGTNLKDMAIDPTSNTIYVADGQLGNIIKLTYNAGTITDQQMYFIPNVKPAGLCIDDLGNLLVVSNAATANQVPIIKYGKNGTEALRFTTVGKNNLGPSGVSSVGDVAYDPRNGGTIYVVAQLSSNSKIVILRFDSQGNFIRYFGEDVGMINPVGMEVGSDGTLYVLDQGANLIHQFGPAK